MTNPDPETNLSVVLTFRVPAQIKAIFDRICYDNDITMSTFMRDALKAHAKMYLQRKDKAIDRAVASPPKTPSKPPRARRTKSA